MRKLLQLVVVVAVSGPFVLGIAYLVLNAAP